MMGSAYYGIGNTRLLESDEIGAIKAIGMHVTREMRGKPCAHVCGAMTKYYDR